MWTHEAMKVTRRGRAELARCGGHGSAANEQEVQEEARGRSCVNKTEGVRTSLTLGDLLAYKDPH